VLPWWNRILTKLPAPHNRLSRRALDSRKAGSRTVSFHTSIEPTFGISTRSEHSDEHPGGGTKCSSNIMQAVHIRRVLRVVDSSSGRSSCSQEHELGTAPTDTWLSVCVCFEVEVLIRRIIIFLRICRSATVFAFIGPVKLKTTCCPSLMSSFPSWGGGA
jgi:hypothetical protein